MKNYECEGVVELKLKFKTNAYSQESAANELSEKFNYVGEVISKHILKEMGIKNVTATTSYFTVEKERDMYNTNPLNTRER